MDTATSKQLCTLTYKLQPPLIVTNSLGWKVAGELQLYTYNKLTDAGMEGEVKTTIPYCTCRYCKKNLAKTIQKLDMFNLKPSALQQSYKIAQLFRQKDGINDDIGMMFFLYDAHH